MNFKAVLTLDRLNFIDKSILVGAKKFVESICRYIREPSDVFLVCLAHILPYFASKFEPVNLLISVFHVKF